MMESSLFLGSRQQLARLVTIDINVNGSIVSKSTCIKYLGADLDERMSLKAIITQKCRVAMDNMQKLVLIRKSLTLEAATQRLHTTFSFRLRQYPLFWLTKIRYEETAKYSEYGSEGRHRTHQV